MGVTLANPGVFTTGDASNNDASKFVSDDASYAVIKNVDGQLELIVPVAYQDAAWNAEVKTVDFTEKTCEEYTEVTSGLMAWGAGWHVVNGDVTIASRITVTGDAHLILCDGATLTASAGMNVSDGNSLTIYA